MPYVERDESSHVAGLYAQLQQGYAEEFLPDDDPEVVAFLHPPLTAKDYQIAVQATVDATAVSKQFNDGVSLASYKDSTVPLWASQAEAFIAWRDQVWAYAYGELAKVQAGQRAQPSVHDFIAELPVIEWPE